MQKERLLKERQEAFKNEIETMSGVLKAQLDAANKKYEGNLLYDLSSSIISYSFLPCRCGYRNVFIKIFFRFASRHPYAGPE